MIINGDGGYGLLAVCIGGPAAQADLLGLKVGGLLARFLYSSREPSELSQWLCYDDSTINVVVVIIIIFIITLEVKQEVNFEDFGDDNVDVHHVGRRQERVRRSR